MSDESSTAQPALPASGPGSPASWARRFLALLIDWALANVVAAVLVGGAAWDPQSGWVWAPLTCWYLMVTATTATAGGSMGQLLLRLRVAGLRGRRPGLGVAAVRTLLIALVIPPLVFTKDGRGLHDLAVNTVVVNIA